jgi:hypothetical protein
LAGPHILRSLLGSHARAYGIQSNSAAPVMALSLGSTCQTL